MTAIAGASITASRVVAAAIVLMTLVALMNLPFKTRIETPFAAENRVAMGKMMAQMSPRQSGNVDRDFAIMMIAHHQGAIDMALAELRHGRNERLRRMAQAIVIEQQQEIAAMRSVLDEELAFSSDAVESAPICRSALGD